MRIGMGFADQPISVLITIFRLDEEVNFLSEEPKRGVAKTKDVGKWTLSFFVVNVKKKVVVPFALFRGDIAEGVVAWILM